MCGRFEVGCLSVLGGPPQRTDRAISQSSDRHTPANEAEGFRLYSIDQLLLNAFALPALLAQEEAAPNPAEPTSIFGPLLVPVVGMFFLYYFIVIVPERRQKRQDATMKSSLKKNDRIVTIGGIHGTVVAAPPDSNVVTIRIDESGTTRVKINRSAIATIVSDKDAQTEKHGEKHGGKHKETVSDTKDT